MSVCVVREPASAAARPCGLRGGDEPMLFGRGRKERRASTLRMGERSRMCYLVRNKRVTHQTNR